MFGGVPEPALFAGLVGVVPYAAASIATLLLTWDINAATHSTHALKDATSQAGTHTRPSFHLYVVRSLTAAFWLDPQTAGYWLEILQSVQITYGAILLSFLGAIHWGLEFAGMGGHLVHSPSLDDTVL